MARKFDNLMLGSIELFCLAAEKSSFTQAATTAGLTPAAIGRSVSRLENRLGVQLFIRSTRKIRLSEAGQQYYDKCQIALEQFSEAERLVSGQQIAPSGSLRISVPTTYGHYRVLPHIHKFRELYPKINIEINLSNRNIDFAFEGYDLVIRARNQPDSSLISRTLEFAELIVVATPAYLEKAGTPVSLEDLNDHECIQFLLPSSGQPNPWLFRKLNIDIDIITNGTYYCSEDILGCITLAKNHTGLIQTYRYIVDEDIRLGHLVEVLKPFSSRSRPFSLLYPKSKHISLSLRVFIDFLVANAKSG